jgi:hypothetical protein
MAFFTQAVVLFVLGDLKPLFPSWEQRFFLLARPRDKGRTEWKEVNRMAKRHEHFICVQVS